MRYIYCFVYSAGGDAACGYHTGDFGTDVLALQREGPLVAKAVANHPGLEVGPLVVEFMVLAPYREDMPQHVL